MEEVLDRIGVEQRMTHACEPARRAKRINEQISQCIRYKNRPEGFSPIGGKFLRAFVQFCKFIIKINFIKDINGNTSGTGNIYYDTLIHLGYISLSIFLAYFLHKYIELKYRKKKWN